MAVRRLTLVSLSAAALLAGALTGSAAASPRPEPAVATTTPGAPESVPATEPAPADEVAPTAEATQADGAVALAAASCDSVWWTATSATVETWVPTKNWTGDANCALGEGSHSWGVAALQNVLRQCYGQNIAMDAVFGPATRRAVMNAQTWENAVRGAGLAVDGVYGNNTRVAMTWPHYPRGNAVLENPLSCKYVSWG